MRKGIILAGGNGTRLFPVTASISKQLLPIYNKPMIYYPLATLMLADIREVALITTPKDADQFEHLLGDGSQWGISIQYIQQESPNGLAEAYILAEEFLDGAPSAMILGDNIFYGSGLRDQLLDSVAREEATIFGYHVSDPERYGVVDFDGDGNAIDLQEKPVKPATNCAVSGLYFLDGTASKRARELAPSARGELEIVDLLKGYLEEKLLKVQILNRGYAWLDTGTFESLLDASSYVRMIEVRQNLQIGNLDEIAFRLGLIDRETLSANIEGYPETSYRHYLENLLASA